MLRVQKRPFTGVISSEAEWRNDSGSGHGGGEERVKEGGGESSKETVISRACAAPTGATDASIFTFCSLYIYVSTSKLRHGVLFDV